MPHAGHEEYMYLWFMRSIHVHKELIKVDEFVSEHLEGLAGLGVVHQDYGDVVDVTEVS